MKSSSQGSSIQDPRLKLFFLFDLLLFLGIVIAIIVKSLLSEDGGGAVNDGAFYLALAQNLHDGHGYYLYDSFVAFEPTLFSTWPVGYPTLIYGISIFTGLSVFWASKVVNILCVAVFFIITRLFFSPFVAPYAIVFLFGSIFRRSYCSLSEMPFIFGLYCYCISLSRYMDGKRILLPSVFILSSSIFIFLMRYIGVFVLIPALFLSAMLVYRRQWWKSFTLILVSLSALGLQSLYILNNYWITGLLTGWPRIDAQEKPYDLVVELFLRLTSEANLIWPRSINYHIFLITMALQIFLLFQILRKYTIHKESRDCSGVKDSFFFCSILVSVCYLAAFIFLRFNFAMEVFASRHIAPIIFLVFVGFMRVIQLRLPSTVFHHFVFPRMAVICLLSFLVAFPNKYMYSQVIGDGSIKGYREVTAAIIESFKEVPKGSQVIVFDFCNTDHLHYLRPDLRLIHYPRVGPIYRESPPLDDFLNQFINDQDKAVYISIESSLSADEYHPMVLKYMDFHKQERFSKWEPGSDLGHNPL